MTDQEPAEEKRKKAQSPDDGLGAAGGGGGRSSLALPGASSAPSSPSHSSSSWTRAKGNEQQFEGDSRGRLFDQSANTVSFYVAAQLFTPLSLQWVSPRNVGDQVHTLI